MTTSLATTLKRPLSPLAIRPTPLVRGAADSGIATWFSVAPDNESPLRLGEAWGIGFYNGLACASLGVEEGGASCG